MSHLTYIEAKDLKFSCWLLWLTDSKIIRLYELCDLEKVETESSFLLYCTHENHFKVSTKSQQKAFKSEWLFHLDVFKFAIFFFKAKRR